MVSDEQNIKETGLDDFSGELLKKTDKIFFSIFKHKFLFFIFCILGVSFFIGYQLSLESTHKSKAVISSHTHDRYEVFKIISDLNNRFNNKGLEREGDLVLNSELDFSSFKSIEVYSVFDEKIEEGEFDEGLLIKKKFDPNLFIIEVQATSEHFLKDFSIFIIDYLNNNEYTVNKQKEKIFQLQELKDRYVNDVIRLDSLAFLSSQNTEGNNFFIFGEQNDVVKVNQESRLLFIEIQKIDSKLNHLNNKSSNFEFIESFIYSVEKSGGLSGIGVGTFLKGIFSGIILFFIFIFIANRFNAYSNR